MMKEYSEVLNRWDLIRLLIHGSLKASVHRTMLGTLWYILVPVLQILIYYFLIVVIFRRGNSLGVNPFSVITMGIMHYSILTKCVGFGAPAVYGNSTLQMQVKIEPLVLIAAAYYKGIRISLAGVLLALVGYFAMDPIISYKLLFYPLVLLLWLFFTWIVVLFVACVSVYFRDLHSVISHLFQLLMYSSPVIYTLSMYPDWLREYVLYLPPTVIFALLQWCFFDTALPPIHHILVLLVVLPVGLFATNRLYLWARRGFTKAF